MGVGLCWPRSANAPAPRRVLALAERYSAERLEHACERALAFDDAKYATIKNILANDLDKVAVAPLAPAPTYHQGRFAFARQAAEYASALLGGAP